MRAVTLAWDATETYRHSLYGGEARVDAQASLRGVVRLKSWGKGPRGHAVTHAGANADPVQEQIR